MALEEPILRIASLLPVLEPVVVRVISDENERLEPWSMKATLFRFSWYSATKLRASIAARQLIPLLMAYTRHG